MSDGRVEGISPWPSDQASGLRRLFGVGLPQVVAFASGREACGRTTLLVQTAAALTAAGHGVLIIDENAAPNNAISSFGLSSRYDLLNALNGERSLRQVTLHAAPLLRILPAARAARELDHASRLAAAARLRLADCLQEMQGDVGFILMDTALRRGGHLSPLALAARHMTLVVTAQSTAITNAYLLIKRIAQERGRNDFQVAITRAKCREEARAIFENMRRVAREHLAVRLDYLGSALVPGIDNLAEALLTRLPPVGADGLENAFALPVLGLAAQPGIAQTGSLALESAY